MIGLATRAGVGGARPSARPPNIVFILADDLAMPTCPATVVQISALRISITSPRKDCVSASLREFRCVTATRTALITGRYQYRLRLGWKSPCRKPRCWASQNTDVALAFEESCYGTTLIGNGIWVFCQNLAL